MCRASSATKAVAKQQIVETSTGTHFIEIHMPSFGVSLVLILIALAGTVAFIMCCRRALAFIPHARHAPPRHHNAPSPQQDLGTMFNLPLQAMQAMQHMQAMQALQMQQPMMHQPPQYYQYPAAPRFLAAGPPQQAPSRFEEIPPGTPPPTMEVVTTNEPHDAGTPLIYNE
jgi:hypothetical protein